MTVLTPSAFEIVFPLLFFLFLLHIDAVWGRGDDRLWPIGFEVVVNVCRGWLSSGSLFVRLRILDLLILHESGL